MPQIELARISSGSAQWVLFLGLVAPILGSKLSSKMNEQESRSVYSGLLICLPCFLKERDRYSRLEDLGGDKMGSKVQGWPTISFWDAADYKIFVFLVWYHCTTEISMVIDHLRQSASIFVLHWHKPRKRSRNEEAISNRSSSSSLRPTHRRRSFSTIFTDAKGVLWSATSYLWEASF